MPEEIRAKIENKWGKGIQGAVIGELTGADRALVSALEGFEDLKIIGKIQLRQNRVRRGDVVIGITEGGMT